MLHFVEMIGELRVGRFVGFELRHPGIAQSVAALAHYVLKTCVNAVGDEELRVFGPTVVALGQLDFFFAERLAVGGAGVLFVGRSVSDVAIHNDESRAVGAVLAVSKARESMAASLASPTRVTFQP